MSEYGMAIYVADPNLTFSDAEAGEVARRLASGNIIGDSLPDYGPGYWHPGKAFGAGPFVEGARIHVVSFDNPGLYEAAIWDETCVEEPLAKTCFWVEAWECTDGEGAALITSIVRETLGAEVLTIPIRM